MSLTPIDLKTLEQTRTRLHHLNQSLSRLLATLHHTPGSTLPSPQTLTAQTTILSTSLSSITSLLARERDALETLVAYPATNFPGRTQEGVLNGLLRKRVEVGVEGWIEEGRRAGGGGVGEWAGDVVGEMVARAAVRIMEERDEEEEGEGDDAEDEEEEEVVEGAMEGVARDGKKEKVMGAKSLEDLVMFGTSGRVVVGG